ncbi:MAG TPA: hypothetical protein PKD86_06255, partial [Gemmatales bacterium]|nr:hypothetical protein [Gemmatales bacterium]
RVVLPREQDQRNLDQPFTVVLTGDGYEWTGRWQALHVADAVRRFQEQQQLLRAELGRDVNVDGAYIDQVLLNVYGGPGLHEVWIDDLEVSPHLQPSLPGGGAPGLTTSDGTPATPTAAQIELVKDRLQVNRRPFLLRGTRWAGRSPRELRDLGFNALWIDGQTPETVVAEAVRLGLLLVPELPEEMVNDTPAGGAVNARLTRFVREFPHQDSVLAWQLGARLTHEQGAETQRAAQLVRRSQTHPDRLIAGGVWDGLRGASRNIDLIGLHRWPLATGLELRAYRDWMRQRLNLAEPE